MFFVFVGPKPQKFSKLMDEESPRKSLVKGERFVRHDDTSELAHPVLLILDYAGTFSEERGNCTLICSWERKRRKKRKGEDEGGRNFVFWK